MSELIWVNVKDDLPIEDLRRKRDYRQSYCQYAVTLEGYDGWYRAIFKKSGMGYYWAIDGFATSYSSLVESYAKVELP